jgi:hypothetical protein
MAGIALVGAGTAAYGSAQQGKSAQLLANYNAYQQERNTRMQLSQVQAQVEAQRNAANAEFALRQQEAQARFNNAKTIENQVAGQSAAARVTAQRKTEEYARFVGSQRAAIASSGIVESSGTPLDLLAETAQKIQLEREDSLYADELNRREMFREADLERLGGQLALAGATLDRSSSIMGANLAGAAGQAEYRSGLRRAEIMRLTGQADRAAANNQALAQGIGGLTGAYRSIL